MLKFKVTLMAVIILAELGAQAESMHGGGHMQSGQGMNQMHKM